MSGHKRPCSPAFPPDRPACASAQTCAAHLLIAFALLKGIAGAVAVLVEGQAGTGEVPLHKVRDDGLLVFNGHIVPVKLLIHRDTAVAGNVKSFDQSIHRPFPPKNHGIIQRLIDFLRRKSISDNSQIGLNNK